MGQETEHKATASYYELSLEETSMLSNSFHPMLLEPKTESILRYFNGTEEFVQATGVSNWCTNKGLVQGSLELSRMFL